MFGLTSMKVNKAVIVAAVDEYMAKRYTPAEGEKRARVTGVLLERWSDTAEIEFEPAQVVDLSVVA